MPSRGKALAFAKEILELKASSLRVHACAHAHTHTHPRRRLFN